VFIFLDNTLKTGYTKSLQNVKPTSQHTEEACQHAYIFIARASLLPLICETEIRTFTRVFKLLFKHSPCVYVIV